MFGPGAMNSTPVDIHINNSGCSFTDNEGEFQGEALCRVQMTVIMFNRSLFGDGPSP